MSADNPHSSWSFGAMTLALEKTPCTYQRRRPELTTCYKILQEHLATFVAERDAEGRPLPKYVADEFDAYLRCGILAHGFIRLVCESCSHEMVVAFSCKKCGFCPSCCAKRMAEAATHLTEHVLPMAPYRQFVVSFPIPMRYWLNGNRKFATRVYKIVSQSIHNDYIAKAKAKGSKNPVPGTIAFLQRAGSALNLNPDLHVLALDGTYSRVGDQAKLRCAEAITDDEVAQLLSDIIRRVTKLCVRSGYLNEKGDIVRHPDFDPLFAGDGSDSQQGLVAMANASSISGRIAFGPNAGQYVRRIGGGFGYYEEIPLAKGHRCYSMNGFSMHANTAINTHARERLRQLIEYMARGPLSNERLEITDKGEVKLTLKTPWRNGTTDLLFSPAEFIERLVALVPPPRTHLVRWAGVFAPNSPFRKEITIDPSTKKGFQFHDDDEDQEDEPRKFKNYTWSKMLAKVFKIDVTICPKCQGSLRKIAAVVGPTEVRRYLKHVGLDCDPPARAPPRAVQGEFDYAAVAPEPWDLGDPMVDSDT